MDKIGVVLLVKTPLSMLPIRRKGGNGIWGMRLVVMRT
jgi:hypothetical protein